MSNQQATPLPYMNETSRLGRALDEIQSATRATALKLGIETDDDVIDFIKERGKFKKAKISSRRY